MKVLGIEFAPLFLPLERRLQTAAVLHYFTLISFYGPIAVGLCIYVLFTRFYFIPLLYFAWFVYDHKKSCQGGRRIEWIRRWKFWRYFADYFPITMVKTAELDPNKNFIFGYHPHGIMCFGAYGCFNTESRDFSKVFPGITPRILTLKGMFWFPLHREQVMWAGSCAATSESIKWLLTKEGKGNALIIAVVGAAEAMEAHPGDVNLTLKSRKGFVRHALIHGASLVPVFAFGENDLYLQVENPKGSSLRQFQDKLRKFLGFPTAIYRGRGIFQYNFGFLPYRKPVTVIIGKPIDVEKISAPTEEDIKILHEKYINSLTALFEEHKKKYAPDLKLIIN